MNIANAIPKITINFKYNDMSIEMITTTITVKNIFLRRCALCLEITLVLSVQMITSPLIEVM